MIHSGIEIRKHSINGTREWLWKTVFWFKKHALSTYNAATCMQLVLANAEQQHATAVQTYNITTVQSVLTVLRAHRVCVLWNSSLERI